MSDEPSFYVEHFGDTTPETVTEGAGLASSYMDSLASWLMLLPEKAHHLVEKCKGMTFKTFVCWLVAFYCLGVAIYAVRNWKRVLTECRLLTLTPSGMLATGINASILWSLYQAIFK